MQCELESFDLGFCLLCFALLCFALLCFAFNNSSRCGLLLLLLLLLSLLLLLFLQSIIIRSQGLFLLPIQRIETTVHNSGWWALDSSTWHYCRYTLPHNTAIPLHIAYCSAISLLAVVSSVPDTFIDQKTILCTTYSQLHPLLFCFKSYNYCVDVG